MWLPLPLGKFGQLDFLSYWSVAYLLVHSGDPYSAPALDQVYRETLPFEHAHTDPVYHPPWALGPPWLLLIVAPLGFLPFPICL